MQLEEANRSTSERMIIPVVNITDSNSSLEVNLITGSDTKFSLCDIISITEEEGAEVLSATYNKAGNIDIFSIHCQVHAFQSKHAACFF